MGDLTSMQAILDHDAQHGHSHYSKGTETMQAVGVMHSTLYTPSGWPRPGAGYTGGLNGQHLNELVLGQLDAFRADGTLKLYLTGLTAASDLPGTMLFYDRLWHNGTITITTTTAQNITQGAIYPRDREGGTSGHNMMVALEVSATTGNGGAITNTTISYTNQAGTAGRTGTIESFPAGAVTGTFTPFDLQAGDTGVRSIQSLTLGTSYVSGTIHLVHYRVLAMVGCRGHQGGRGPKPSILNALSVGYQRVWNDTLVCVIWIPSGATTGARIYGHLSKALESTAF